MRYIFSGLILAGDGDSPEEAWEEAIEAFSADPGDMPSFEIDEEAEEEDEN